MWLPEDLRDHEPRALRPSIPSPGVLQSGSFELWADGWCQARIVDDGTRIWAYDLNSEGQWHGTEREWIRKGPGEPRLRYRAHYQFGLQHGPQEQWNGRGRLLLSTPFRGGTGIDLWHCGGNVWEVGEIVRGVRHGFARTFVGRRRVLSERHFADGLEHGIERLWKDDGTLARGYPRFFLQGERATKRAYERRCQSEPSLKPWAASEDDPRRPFPSSLLR